MTERMYFFDSTEDDERIYQAADFARFHAQIIGNGVSNTADLPDLDVSAKTNMNVALGAGYMFANGYMYENSETRNLTHDVADPDNDRIDRVVVRFDNNPEKREIKAVIKKGTPARSPVAPSLTRDSYVYEMSVAQVKIIAGKSFIEQYQITDERANGNVCGYIPLHNIYRGLGVNEHGMITMPNQSYVEMNKRSPIYSPTTVDGASSGYDYFEISLDTEIDRQKEVNSNTFKTKEKGTFLFTFHTRMDANILEDEKIEAFLVVNGESSPTQRLYLFNTYGPNIQFYGTNIKHLNKSDEVKLVMGFLRVDSFSFDYIRLNIAKLN